jgi:hypothetical protein
MYEQHKNRECGCPLEESYPCVRVGKNGFLWTVKFMLRFEEQVREKRHVGREDLKF